MTHGECGLPSKAHSFSLWNARTIPEHESSNAQKLPKTAVARPERRRSRVLCREGHSIRACINELEREVVREPRQSRWHSPPLLC
jgi:hypothetical protein